MIPEYDRRKKIDRGVTKRFLEHLIIYYDISKNKQIWQTCIREHNKPYVIREITYHLHQTPELLFQKLRGLVFTLEEEDKIGLEIYTITLADDELNICILQFVKQVEQSCL